MTAQNKESMPNLGFAGFLMKKTIQPFSLRQRGNAFIGDFKNTNMVMFINKKLADVRQRLGTNHIPFDFLYNPCLKIKPQKKNLEEMRKDVYDGLDKEIKIQQDSIYKGNKFNRNTKTKRSKSDENKKVDPKIKGNKIVIPAGKKISSILHNVLTEDELLNIYYQYKLKMRKKHYEKDLSPDFIKTLQTYDENKMIQELSQKNQMNLSRLLGLDREVIKEFILDDCDENDIEKVKKIEEAKNMKNKTKRLSTADITNLMAKEEKKNVSQSLENFNKTRIENMNLERTKKKKVMTSQSFFFKLKEKNDELDHQIFEQHLSDIHDSIRQKNNPGQGKFIRNKRDLIGNLRNRLLRNSESLYESLSSTRKSLNSMKSQQQNVKMNDFILDFSSKLNDQKKETKSIEKDLKGIEKIMERVSEGSNRKTVRLNQDENFKEFLDQREFKKKLLNNFIEKIVDPQSILSHYRKKLPPEFQTLK